MNGNNFKYSSLVTVVLTLLFCTLVLTIYVPKTLLGNFDFHVLSSKMFGVPSELRQKGISELYSKFESGWDGQFYYYIANDILASKDTAEHLDAAAYRYQRVGLPLLAHIVSRLTFQDWVSPSLYFLTSLGLILIATYMAAEYFRKRGSCPYWALVWSLGYGTQVTLLNGLPDAAADALLIIAILSLLQGKLWIYAAAAMFAGLSREVYVIVPTVIGVYSCYAYFRQGGTPSQLSDKIIYLYFRVALPHIPALLAIVGWQWYLHYRFGVSPSSQAAGILGLPFVTTVQYLFWNLSGAQLLIRGRIDSYAETAALLGYVALLFITFVLALSALRDALARHKNGTDTPDSWLVGFYLAVLIIVGLYTAFGPTVIMDRTGYLKAANFFLFVVPFIIATEGKASNLLPSILLPCLIVAATSILIYFRINLLPNFSRYTTPDNIELISSEPACILRPTAQLILLTEPPKAAISESIWNWSNNKLPMIYQVKVHNTSDETFFPFQGKGGVNLSYQWLNQNQAVIKDGVRTILSKPLASGEESVRPVVVVFPSKPGDYILRLSLVQEGCFWFYGKEPSSAYDIRYKIE
jgi:hypothetical protein